MCRLALELGNVHMELGLLLGLSPAVVEQIVYDYQRLPDITFGVLVRWREDKQNSETIMVDELCRALNYLGLRCFAEKVVSDEYLGI